MGSDTPLSASGSLGLAEPGTKYPASVQPAPLVGYARREAMALRRDPIRFALALLGPILLLRSGPPGDARPALSLPTLCDTYRLQERAQAVYVGHDTHQRTIINDRQAANRVLQEHSGSLCYGNIRTDAHHICGHTRLDRDRRHLVGDLAVRQCRGGGR